MVTPVSKVSPPPAIAQGISSSAPVNPRNLPTQAWYGPTQRDLLNGSPGVTSQILDTLNGRSELSVSYESVIGNVPSNRDAAYGQFNPHTDNIPAGTTWNDKLAELAKKGDWNSVNIVLRRIDSHARFMRLRSLPPGYALSEQGYPEPSEIRGMLMELPPLEEIHRMIGEMLRKGS